MSVKRLSPGVEQYAGKGAGLAGRAYCNAVCPVQREFAFRIAGRV